MNNKIFRRSIYAIKKYQKEQNLQKNIKIIRPGYGVSPLNYLQFNK